MTISLNKHNVQNHFLDLAGSEKLTATWKSCIMNVNICHLQVSHSQTLIQPRAGCGKGEGGQMVHREVESESETCGGGLTSKIHIYTAGLKLPNSGLITLLPC